MNSKHLFVYGTLRPGFGDTQAAPQLLSNATYVGPAAFQGRLYQIDWYPGVIDSENSAHQVVGDLFDIGENLKIFEELDAYEGCSASDQQPHQYRREVREVMWGGRSVSAWIYLYAWPLDAYQEIVSGDFSRI